MSTSTTRSTPSASLSSEANKNKNKNKSKDKDEREKEMAEFKRNLMIVGGVAVVCAGAYMIGFVKVIHQNEFCISHVSFLIFFKKKIKKVLEFLFHKHINMW